MPVKTSASRRYRHRRASVMGHLGVVAPRSLNIYVRGGRKKVPVAVSGGVPMRAPVMGLLGPCRGSGAASCIYVTEQRARRRAGARGGPIPGVQARAEPLPA